MNETPSLEKTGPTVSPHPLYPPSTAPPQGWVLAHSVGRCCTSPACKRLISPSLSLHIPGLSILPGQSLCWVQGYREEMIPQPREIHSILYEGTTPRDNQTQFKGASQISAPFARWHPWGWSFCLGMSVLSKVLCSAKSSRLACSSWRNSPHSRWASFPWHDSFLDSCLLSPHTVDPQGWPIRLMSVSKAGSGPGREGGIEDWAGKHPEACENSWRCSAWRTGRLRKEQLLPSKGRAARTAWALPKEGVSDRPEVTSTGPEEEWAPRTGWGVKTWEVSWLFLRNHVIVTQQDFVLWTCWP